MSPSRFLRRPASWLRAISDYRGTLSPAPNFAYAYATARVRDEELAGVDLTSWRVAFCGAEPIDARTLHGFHDRFENHGLRKDVILPCYGLAEASLAVTFHESGMPFRSERLDREALSAGMAMQTEPKQSSDGSPISGVEPVEVVSCGRPLKGTELRIVGPGGEDLDEGRVGRIVLRGPSVMKGYFGDAERSASTLQNGWLDSGDMGYLRDGQLYVTGREKDVIILRGKCYAPTEFEWPASETPGVRKGCAVAFGAFDPKHGTEVLHVVCETEVTTEEERARLREEVARRIALRAGVRPEVVRLVRRDAIPKTTSGKVQRSKTKAFCTESRPSSHWKVA
jgi:acyl-CoA synthetase (AMP-forming)/AMP-acid ligase II